MGTSFSKIWNERDFGKNIGYLLLSTAESEKLKKFTLTDIAIKNFDPKEIKLVIGVWQKDSPKIASAYEVSKDEISIKDGKVSWIQGNDQFTWLVDGSVPKAPLKDMAWGIPDDTEEKLSVKKSEEKNDLGN